MDRQQMERCLEQVAAYRASGQRANQWAAANGVALRALSSWCAHSRRWQARLDGVACEPAARKPARCHQRALERLRSILESGEGRGEHTTVSGGARKPASGFVAASLPANRNTSASVRIELSAGATRVEVHWPVAHTRELAAWLREVGR